MRVAGVFTFLGTLLLVQGAEPDNDPAVPKNYAQCEHIACHVKGERMQLEHKAKQKEEHKQLKHRCLFVGKKMDTCTCYCAKEEAHLKRK
jgi:hypothetical protein